MTEAPSKDLRTNIQLSKKTIDILRNFSTINKSILIKTGKWVETMSVNKNIIAMTQVSEAFPEDMAIYDLPLFLGALSLFKKPWLHFPDDKKVIIYDEDTQGKTVFYYSDPEIIVTPPDFNTNLPDVELMFDLPHTDINQLLQAAKVYGVEDLCVNGFQGEYSICVRDNKNKTSNVFSLPLKKVIFEQGPREDDDKSKPYTLTPERQTFCYCFKVENLKLLDAGYHVTISQKGIANFGSLSHSDLNYFIALEP
tara:strand:- start:33 stop:791 length:759 start_codon:yes stop_codon:yes gene_type:complete